MAAPTLQKQTESGPTQEREATPRVVRLSVNLAPSVAAALKSTADKQGVSITEAIRRAVALWKLVSDARDNNQRIMLAEGHGDSTQYRELIII